jgi:hypothetical protein
MQVFIEVKRGSGDLFEAHLIAVRDGKRYMVAQATMSDPKAAIDRCLELESFSLVDLVDGDDLPGK